MKIIKKSTIHIIVIGWIFLLTSLMYTNAYIQIMCTSISFGLFLSIVIMSFDKS
jgi:hypothetical protein